MNPNEPYFNADGEYIVPMSNFARKNLIQAGFIAGAKFAGFDKNRVNPMSKEEMERYKQFKEAIMDCFEKFGLSREIEF